ncbi:MAG TPA: zf-HC2 domain-containing protein [Thermoanaerobaculia bacterium]|jgi:hypothetical protein|nr:zf-HC2 domain-containing protein [Thermoanaerobaculia bacterium]
MTMKDEELSRLQAAFAAPAPPAGSCPEPDRIWEAVRGELPPEEVREIVDHVAICASCAEDWRVAVAFEKEAAAQQGNEDVVRPLPARRFQPWIAAAAAALVLTVGGVYFQQPQKPVPEYRGGESKVESLVPPGGILPRQSFVLAWKPVPGAESYDLLVTTTELDSVVNLKNLTTTRYQVPADALANLPAGALLHWSVAAVFPDGSREQSPTFMAALE